MRYLRTSTTIILVMKAMQGDVTLDRNSYVGGWRVGWRAYFSCIRQTQLHGLYQGRGTAFNVDIRYAEPLCAVIIKGNLEVVLAVSFPPSLLE